ncbi:MAG: acyltransferase family protein [Gemmatimonadota bacterium]
MVAARTAERAAPARPVVPAHQDALDGLRAAAAGAVLLTHVNSLTGYTFTGTPVSWVLSRGDVGVPIFFALSGLLLYRPWAAAVLSGTPRRRLLTYVRRRALRILPAYWAVVLIALPVLNPGPARHLGPWLQYLLLVQNYDSHPWWSGTGAIGLEQAWSLVVEVSFYLILPVLAAALAWVACRGRRRDTGTGGEETGRRARRLLTGIAVLAASSPCWTVLTYYPRPNFWFYATLPPLMIWFCAGMAIAVLLAWAQAEPGPDGPASRLCRSVAASAGMCALIAACAFAIACTPLTGPEFVGVAGLWASELRTLLYALIALAVVAPVACQPLLTIRAGPAISTRLLSNRVARFLGKISYGIFIWQFLAAYAFFRLARLETVFHGGSYRAPEVVLIGAAIAAATIVTAAVSYYLIERPAQRLRMPHWAGRRTPQKRQPAG